MSKSVVAVIISKPRSNTIVSFMLFLMITVVVISLNLTSILNAGAWYHYVMIILLIPIALIVINRIFLKYKVVQFGNNKIMIEYPVIRRQNIYELNQVKTWKEVIIKTGKNSVYKELEIEFEDHGRLKLGDKEHTEYSKIISYLSQKIQKKKV